MSTTTLSPPTATSRSSGELSIDVSEIWRLAVKHRFTIIGATLAALIIGAIVTMVMTPIYTASTTLQIDREAARVLDVDGVQPRESATQGEEFFQTQYGLLRSRSLAERVSESLGLANSDAFLIAMKEPVPSARGEGGAAERRKAVIEVLQDNLDVAPVRGSRLVSVSFESPDPALAARVVNAFAENFIQSNLDRKYESSAYARRFLEERLASTKVRLEESERAVVAYAQNQQIINLNDGEGSEATSRSLVSTNLDALNSALATARAERIAAEAKWRQASGGQIMTLPEVISNSTVQRLTEARATLRAEYEQKLQVYQPDYPEMRQLEARISELTGQINSVAGGIRESIRGDYQVALARERSFGEQVNGLKGDILDLRNRTIQYNNLQREADTNRTLYEGLLQRYKEVGVTGAIAANNISIIDQSNPPTTPSKPRLFFNLAFACFLGLGLGVLAALVLEALDQSIASPEDVETKIGLPILGVIPLLEKGQSPDEGLADSRSSFSEAYHSLRTALQFSTPTGAPRSILVTSSRPAEGKSTTAYAVALNLARLGRRVLLADGDLRNPSMHRTIGVDNDAGMSNLLSSERDLASLTKPTGQDGLDFIACGPLPPNPAELWGGDGLRRVLEHASLTYDHIVIDGPPVLGFADAPLLAAAVDGTIFVMEARGTRRAQVQGALRRLRMGSARLLGGVLTKFNTKSIQYGGYSYAYDYTYGPASSPSTGPRNGRKSPR